MIENEAILESRIKNGSENLGDYESLIKICLDKGDFNRILELCDMASTLPLSHGEQAVILYDMGQANELLGKKEDAILCYEKSLALETDENEESFLHISGMNCYYLASLFLPEGKGVEYAKRALGKFETLLRKYPDYDEKHIIHAYLSELYSASDEYDKAIDSYHKAIEAANNDEDRLGLLVGLGSTYRGNGDYQKSEEALKQALRLAKGKRYLSKINFDLGILYFKLDRTQDAIEAFSNALKFLEFDPFFRDNKEYAAEIFWHLGLLYYDNDEYDRVIEYLEKTLENIEEDHVYYCNTQITLGHCYFGKGDYNRAQSYYDGVLLFPLATNEEIDMANKGHDECLKQIERNMGLE